LAPRMSLKKELFKILGVFLTLLKPLNAIFVLWSILYDHNWLGAVAIIWLIICDIFDGFFFSRSSLSNNKNLFWWRRVFDVTIDYVALLSVSTVLLIYYDFPLYLYIFLCIREIILLFILLYGYWLKNPLREPNLSSRLSQFSGGLMIAIWLIFPSIAFYFLIPLIIFGILGSKKYYRTITSNV